MDRGYRLHRKANWSFCVSRIILAVIFLVFICGCGAKTAITGKAKDLESLDIRSGETIAIVLGEYKDNAYENLSDDRKEKTRISVEKMFSDCLSQNAKRKNKQITIIPSENARKELHDIYGIEHFDVPVSNIIDDIKKRSYPIEPINKIPRYLLIIDVTTLESGSAEPTLDGSGGAFLIGMAKEGQKQTQANVHVVDLLNFSEIEYLNSYSNGKEGWATGVMVFIIIPVPYYVPWWSNTESEVCESVGRTLVDMIVVK